MRAQLAVLLAAILVPLFPSSSSARPLTAWDVAHLQSAGSVDVSPDGRFVAFTVSVPRIPIEDENGPNFSELHVYDRESGEVRPFVTGEVDVSGLDWTPDSRSIGYLAKRGDDEYAAIYVIPVDGGESRRLIGAESKIEDFAFGPDGRRVAWLAKDPKSEEETAREEAGFDAKIHEETARPARLHVTGLEGLHAAGETRTIPIEGHVSDLSWGADTDRVLATVAPTSLIDARYNDRQYVTIDVETGQIAGRIETRGKLGEAWLSPDGRMVALIGPDSVNDPSAGRLLVASADGGKPRILLGAEFAGEVAQIRWSGDDELLVLADVGVHAIIGRIAAGGGELKPILEQPHPLPTAFDVSTDGGFLACRAESPSHPSELFFAKTGKALERVTDLNPWLAQIDLAPQRVFEWEARDGLALEGVLIEPLDPAAREGAPLIVSVHGGPESHEQDGWKTTYSRLGQFAAAEGFAVFYPNYRGSTGRGVEFSMLSQGDPGGAEFDDVVDGVKALVASGLVDENRVGITGGSYGGYATAWGATKLSEHYAAAVMFVGISEQVSKFGTTDIPRESQLVHQHPRKVYDDWDFFRDRSPIFHAGGSTTPLLILHGEEDPRVHPSQSLIMYRYFEHLAEAPVRLVWYPGEPHGNRKAAGRLDYSLRALRWMKHFLMESGEEAPPWEIDHEAAIEGMKAAREGTTSDPSAR